MEANRIKPSLNKITKSKVTRFLPIISLFLSVSFLSAETAPLTMGQKLNPIQLTDQFSRPLILSTDIKIILFAADKAGGKLIQAWMNDREDSFLKQTSTVLIVDIHKMPSILISTIGLPLLRTSNFSMQIIKDDQTGLQFAQQESKVTLFKLSNLEIEQVQFANSVAEIEAIFNQLQK